MKPAPSDVNDELPGPTLAFLWGHLQEATRENLPLRAAMIEALDDARAQGLPVPDALAVMPCRPVRRGPAGMRS